MSAYTQ